MRTHARRTGAHGPWLILVLLLIACGGSPAPAPTGPLAASPVGSPATPQVSAGGTATRASQATPVAVASATREVPNATPLATRGTVATPTRTPVPSPAAWRPGGELGIGRAGHTATLLRDGSVLVVGGYAAPRPEVAEFFLTATAERFDPASDSWRPAASLATAREGHTATLLADGTVLVVGGTGDDEAPLAAAERYDPVADRWLPAGALTIARSAHTATLLADGTVLVVGGGILTPAIDPDEEDDFATTATTERFDPIAGRWSPAPELATPREGHTATRLASGEVLVVGGLDYADEEDEAGRTAERFDPQADAWRPAAHLATVHYDHSATLLNDGTVLVVGGGNTREIERYDPAGNRWSGSGRLSTTRTGQTATLLNDGLVLIVGGDGESFQGLERVEVYLPATETTIVVADTLAPRSGHTATILPSGTVLVAGGWGEFNAATDYSFLASTERLDTRLPLIGPEVVFPLYRAVFSRWPSYLANGGVVAYDAPTAGYRIRVPSGGSNAANPPERTVFGDFTLETDVELIAGSDGFYGLTFREQRPAAGQQYGSFYLFFVTPAGQFALYFYDETGTFQTLQPPVSSAAILPGEGRNQFRITCKGDRISLAVNGKAIGQYVGSAREAGWLGLVVSAEHSASKTEAIFSDLRVTPAR